MEGWLTRFATRATELGTGTWWLGLVVGGGSYLQEPRVESPNHLSYNPPLCLSFLDGSLSPKD